MADTTSSGGKSSVYVTALDGLVHVNSLFSGVVFLGLSFSSSSSSSSSTSSTCTVDETTVKRLVLFEITSFSCFLFSTMVAYALKLALHLLHCKGHGSGPSTASIHSWVLRFGVMLIAFSSWLGCVFLLLSMSFIILVRLGPTSSSCITPYNTSSITILSLVVGSAVLIYFATVSVYVWWSSYTQAPPNNNNNNNNNNQAVDDSQTTKATSSLSKPLIEEQA
ncbi:hypothetical protein CDL15_Pgr020027 [Punica granatum]|uniref:Uncharacterized protein n=1 Tax=Punica granatum TaxID=22663 RepID=A0A218VQW2_PUNGR|nr:hypothetical protein CDL15_Pgr020027 [Punica granatum]